MSASSRPRLIRTDPLDLPASPELEQYVLGGILNSAEPNEVFERVSGLLSASAFSSERNRVVFRAMQNIASAGLRIGYAMLVEELQGMRLLGSVASLADLRECP